MDRCEWGAVTELMTAYHDQEWGVPLHDDRMLFEFLVLEGAQAGLSWNTILNKRQNYRDAFDDFDPETVAQYGDAKVRSLLADAGIVRNRLKIAAAITNAQAHLAVAQEFGSFDLGFRGRQPQGQLLGVDVAGSGQDRRIGRHEQGPENQGVQVHRLDHLLRLHAGDRHGQRPQGGLLQVRTGLAAGQLPPPCARFKIHRPTGQQENR